MIVAIDVSYNDDCAKVVAGVFECWGSESLYKKYFTHLGSVCDYESGQFFKRELPCLVEILSMVIEEIDCIVIDGYVFLGDEKKPGLGKYLWDALLIKKPIIGVAKNYYKGTAEENMIVRGTSKKPLYVTCIGLDLIEAKNNIMTMYGKSRMPLLLKEIDLETKAQ